MNAALINVDRLVTRPYREPAQWPLTGPLLDQLGRSLTDLRLSVTDRCNFRCGYCMPRSKIGWAVPPTDRGRQLDFDEIVHVTAAFVALGVDKVRITGGEPLLRPDLASLVGRLARLAIRDLCITTNGSLLASQAAALADAGLRRVTVSFDAIDELTFRRMTDGHTPVSRVLDGIDAARRQGLAPVKINMVVQRGVNEHAVLDMAAWARREGLELRYIEYMDVGCSNGWHASDVVTAKEISERVHGQWPIEPWDTDNTGGTALRFRYVDGGGKIGIIAAVSRPFCGGCTRARISSDGAFYPCLFAPAGVDLSRPLRDGSDLVPIIAGLWQRRTDRYSELRADLPRHLPRREMSAIGG